MTTIPKIIHYVWVGGRPLTPLALSCIESWKTHAPDYELRLWNEENIPLDHQYVIEMYRMKRWAFVSDYVRFWALEREGGIYLDTDMELFRPLDTFLEQGAFLGRSKSGHVESSIVGASAGHPFIRAALAFYDRDTEFSTENTSPLVLERIFKSGAYPDVRVYGPEYFHPCDEGESCRPKVLAQAYARHHWAESWVPFASLRKALRRVGIMPALRALKRGLSPKARVPYRPLVSIAMTTYNGGDLIREQVDSILAQTYQNLELVISDDGSDEKTVAILNEYAKKDPRVSWSRSPLERGYVKNTENSISLCKGEIIFLCDQDDTWYPKKVEKHVERYQDPSVTWVYNRLVITDATGNEIGHLEDTLPDYYRHKTMLENAWGTCIGGAQTSYRASVVKKAMPVGRYAPAHDSWIQLAINPMRGTFINEILQTYRQHGANEVGVRVFTPEEEAERETRAIYENLRYLRNLPLNSTLPLWKRTFFLLVYIAKRARAVIRKARSRFVS
ncbi:MAG TPA: glycosyltransferase [Candidatus Paceibacterota bacterium]